MGNGWARYLTVAVEDDERLVIAQRPPRSWEAAAAGGLAGPAGTGDEEAHSVLLGQGCVDGKAPGFQRFLKNRKKATPHLVELLELLLHGQQLDNDIGDLSRCATH